MTDMQIPVTEIYHKWSETLTEAFARIIYLEKQVQSLDQGNKKLIARVQELEGILANEDDTRHMLTKQRSE